MFTERKSVMNVKYKSSYDKLRLIDRDIYSVKKKFKGEVSFEVEQL